MKNKNSKKVVTKIIAIMLLILVVAGGIVGYIALFHQKEAVINDYTENSQEEESTFGSESTGNEPEVVISSNVNMFTEEEAEKINESIQSVQFMNTGIHLQAAKGSALDNMGIGDIFYLEGNENTPLGEIYIGKITSKSEDETENTYIVEAPMVDEVFDVLKFEYSQIMMIDNISDIQTMEGVNVVTTDNLAFDFAQTTNHQVSNLVYQNNAEQQFQVSSGGSTEGLLFDFNIDLLKTFGLNKDTSGEFQEKYDVTEGGRITVYRANTGICYHREHCACVGRSKADLTLTEAVLEGFEPCYLCNPPLLGKDKNYSFAPSLTLEGKVGLESIDFNVDYEWDILNGSGLEELELSANGNILAQAEVKSNLELEFGGRTTTINVPVADVKFQGLKEKLFPLAFIGYNGTFTPVVSGNENIRALTGAVPVTVGAMVYIDISGNVSVSARAYIDYNQSFHYKNCVVRNGEWVLESDIKSNPVLNTGIETEVQGDMDAHLGCSIDLYVFNLNVVDLALAEFGGEAEGTLKIDYSNETQRDSDSAISGSYYMRLYLKLLELNIRLKTQIELWNVVDVSKDLSYTLLYLDKTLAEWGSKNPVRFYSGTMSYSTVTAQDEEAFYYKNTDGNLIREIDGYKTTIYDKGFFSICGIDESYIYVLKAKGEETYDIYRISKEGKINKKIVVDVLECFTMDEEYLYYLSEFDKTSIYRINRESLKEEVFADFKDSVTFMEKQEEAFYVVTEDENSFAAFFGRSPLRYYLIDVSGNLIEEYGENPDISQYFYSSHGNYYKAAKMMSSGYLRNVAQKIYWVSRDKQQNVLVEQVSGWNTFDEGICTTLNNENTGQEPYTIVLYQAENGQRVEMTDVYSDQAFFTLCKGDNGNWYFFDQTEQELILYELRGNFSGKRAVKKFSLNEFPCNLSECSMEIMDNRLYLYTMPDSQSSQVLYRYDIL